MAKEIKCYKKLDGIKNPTLEDILIALNGGKNEKMFLKHVQRDDDGYVTKTFTVKGAKLYGALTSILFAVGRLTGDRTEDTVETLDEIANEE